MIANILFFLIEVVVFYKLLFCVLLYRNGERYPWISSSLYRYEVERMDTGEEAEVGAELISRKKSCYTKDKNRLYIKQFVHLDNGYWRLKVVKYFYLNFY